MKLEKRKGLEINRIEVLWNYNNMGDIKNYSIFNLDDLFDFCEYFKGKMGMHVEGVAYVYYYDKKLSEKKYLTQCNSSNEFLDLVGHLAGGVGDGNSTIGIKFEIK